MPRLSIRRRLAMPQPLRAVRVVASWICWVLAFCLPVQLSWAVAAGYCGLEGPTVLGVVQPLVHPGHHEHAAPAQESSPKDSAAVSAASLDLDCDVCHGASLALMPRLGGVSFLPVQRVMREPAPPRRASVPSPRPERPQWPLRG